MIDTDDLDRLLRDELASAAELHAPPSDPAPRVATHVRRRRRRRAALRVSVAASVTVLAVLAFAFTRPTDTTAPAHRPPVPAPSVLSTPQVAADRFARTLLGDRQVPIDWASVRLLEQQGQARVFGARDTHGVLCSVLVVPDSKGQLSAGTGCGSNGTLTARAAAPTSRPTAPPTSSTPTAPTRSASSFPTACGPPPSTEFPWPSRATACSSRSTRRRCPSGSPCRARRARSRSRSPATPTGLLPERCPERSSERQPGFLFPTTHMEKNWEPPP